MSKKINIYTSIMNEETHQRIIPEYDTIIETKSITITDLYSVMERMDHFRNYPNNEERLVTVNYYNKFIALFESIYGQIKYMDVSIKHKYLLILTKKYLFNLIETEDLPTATFLYLCDKLRMEAYQHLQSQTEPDKTPSKLKQEKNEPDKLLTEKDELYITLDQINTLISHAFTSWARFKDKKINEQEHHDVINYLTQEYQKVFESFIQRANRIALLTYYQGMVNGIFYVGLMAIIGASILFLMGIPYSLIIALVGSTFVGGMGAIISVFSRMSSRKFSLDYTAGTPQNKRLGVFRPIIGSTMGVIVYFLLMSGLTPFNIPVDGATRIYYVLSIAFTAGFTERWATGLLPGKEKEEAGGDTSNDKKKGEDVQVQNNTSKSTVKSSPKT